MRDSAQVVEPPYAVQERVLDVMEEAYHRCRVAIEDDFDSYEKYLCALDRLDRNSSPGYPYSRQFTTNGQWLGWNGVTYDQQRVLALWHDVRSMIETHKVESIMKVFIKQEPHTELKIQQGRYRLIMASSLQVQVLWHMLFDDFNDALVGNAYYIPSQHGIILPRGQWKTFYNQWKHNRYDIGLDSTAYDWTIAIFFLRMVVRFRIRMAVGKRKEEWSKLVNVVYQAAFEEAILLLSDGSMLKQIYPGVQKSGLVNTIADNGLIIVMRHILVCWDLKINIYPLPKSCGDDELKRSEQAEDLDAYRKYGSVIKSASFGLEFVGHEFTARGPQPLYLGKHLVKAEHVADVYLAEYFDSMCRMYVNSPMFEFWRQFAYNAGVYVFSYEYYFSWYNNSDVA